MANSYTVYNAVPGQQTFTVPFPYLRTQDVNVYVNGIQLLTPKDYTWLNAGAIQLFGALIANATVLIQRSTSPGAALVTYTNGATLTAAQLNTGFLQNFYLSQEMEDQLNQYITNGLTQYQIPGVTSGMSPADMIAQVSAAVLNSSLAQTLMSQISDIQSNAQSILSQAAQITSLQGLVNSLSNVNGTGIATYLANETTSRIDGDTALQSQLNLLGAVNAGNTAFVFNASTAMVSPTQTLAQYISGVTTSITNAVAALQSTVASTYQTIANMSNYTTTANLATALQSTINGSIASALTTYSTTAQMNSAISTSTNGLQSTINGQLATIEATYVTTATLNGLTAATYTLKTNVNGHIAGFGLMNTGTSSQFIIEADQFAVVNDTTGTPFVPFSISGNTVYMQNVVIQDAVISSLSIGKLTQGTLNQDMALGTGRLVFKNANYLKVEGVSFGSGNGFIEWYGPVNSTTWNSSANAPNYANLTPANCVSCMTADGWFYVDGMQTKASSGGATTTGLIQTVPSISSTVGETIVWNPAGGFPGATAFDNTGTLNGLPGTETATGYYQFAMDRYDATANTYTQIATVNTAGFTVTGQQVNDSQHGFVGYTWTTPVVSGFTWTVNDTPPWIGKYGYRVRVVGLFISGTPPTFWPASFPGFAVTTQFTNTLTQSEPNNY